MNDQKFSKILNHIYLTIIIKRSDADIRKKIEDISQKDIKVNIEGKNIDLKFYPNFQIVNEKIYGLLRLLGYELIQNKIYFYFIGNNNVFLKFQNAHFCDEIGFINEQNIFINEFIIYYKTDIDISSLNYFFKNQFNKDSEQKDVYILGNKNTPIGYCFSMKHLNDNKENQQEQEQDNENQNIINNEERVQKLSSKQTDNNDNNEIHSNDDKNNNLYMKYLFFQRKNNNEENIKKEEELNSNSEPNNNIDNGQLKNIINKRNNYLGNNNNTIYDEIKKNQEIKKMEKESNKELEKDLKAK